jgi:hypothetical protein
MTKFNFGRDNENWKFNASLFENALLKQNSVVSYDQILSSQDTLLFSNYQFQESILNGKLVCRFLSKCLNYQKKENNNSSHSGVYSKPVVSPTVSAYLKKVWNSQH